MKFDHVVEVVVNGTNIHDEDAKIIFMNLLQEGFNSFIEKNNLQGMSKGKAMTAYLIYLRFSINLFEEQ